MAMTRLDFSEYRGEQKLRMGIYTEAGEAGRILRVLLFASIVILVCCCVLRGEIRGQNFMMEPSIVAEYARIDVLRNLKSLTCLAFIDQPQTFPPSLPYFLSLRCGEEFTVHKVVKYLDDLRLMSCSPFLC